MVLSNIAHKKTNGLSNTWKNTNSGEEKTINGIRQYLDYIGIENTYEHLFDYSNNMVYNVPYVIGQHDTIAQLGKVNNLERNVITVVIGNCEEDKSAFNYLIDLINGNISNIDNKIDFYKKEAENVYKALVDYDNTQNSERWKKSYWIVGYGTGGSIANLVAKKFIDYKHSNKSVYCYTYGAPSIVDANASSDIKDLANIAYQSIFNIENEDDFILKRTDRKLGYYKYGWKVRGSVDVGSYAHGKELKDVFYKMTSKKYNGSLKDSKEYLQLLLDDYNKNYFDIYTMIKNNKKIAAARSEVSYFVLSSYGEKEPIYVSNFLTDRSKDSDGDGIPDIWEYMGADIDGDGIVDIDLMAMDADPNRKDLYVEIDYMERFMPSVKALQKVVDAFDKHDITLHIDAGPYSINFPKELSESQKFEHFLLVSDKFSNDSYWKKMMNENFNKVRKDIFRYCIYVNVFDAKDIILGIANGIPGNSFIISKGGCFNDDIKEAATFMHELGHTLGLTHGGAKNDNYVYKPNHLSIMNYLYSSNGLYPNNEINYSEYELPTINKNHVDERKGIDPNGVVINELGCKWYFYQDENIVDIDIEKQISNKPIDFNRNGKIEKNYKFNFYFGNSKGNGKVHMADIARETINEWEHLIYKPEDNSMVVENRVLNEGLIELPIGAYDFLAKDEPNNYNFFGLPVYNENGEKFYYEIRLKNKGKTKTIADITTESEELKFNLKNEKVELPKHTNNTISVTKLYIPIKDDLKEKTYDFPVIIKDINSNESTERGIIDLGWGGYEVIKEERRINEQLSQDKVTVIYTIDDYTGRFTYNAFGKEYTLPCEAYQKEEGTWTSDAVDNFDKYVEEAIKSDIENNYTQSIIKQPNNPPIYLIIKIGFGITLVLMLSLIIIFI